jgi:hypothetical protein
MQAWIQLFGGIFNWKLPYITSAVSNCDSFWNEPKMASEKSHVSLILSVFKSYVSFSVIHPIIVYAGLSEFSQRYSGRKGNIQAWNFCFRGKRQSGSFLSTRSIEQNYMVSSIAFQIIKVVYKL